MQDVYAQCEEKRVPKKRWQNLAYPFAQHFCLLGKALCLLVFKAANVHESHSRCSHACKQRIWTEVNALLGDVLLPNPLEEEVNKVGSPAFGYAVQKSP